MQNQPQHGIPGGVRGHLIRSIRTLYGIPTPDGEHPTGRHFSLLWTKITGNRCSRWQGLINRVLLHCATESRTPSVTACSTKAALTDLLVLDPAVVSAECCCAACSPILTGSEKSLRIREDGRLWVDMQVSYRHATGCVGTTALAVIVWYLDVREPGLNSLLSAAWGSTSIRRDAGTRSGV